MAALEHDAKQQDGPARGSQAQYSCKFNEHPDSGEFVSLALSSLCTQRLTGSDTPTEQVGNWTSDPTHQQILSFSIRTRVDKHFSSREKTGTADEMFLTTRCWKIFLFQKRGERVLDYFKCFKQKMINLGKGCRYGMINHTWILCNGVQWSSRRAAPPPVKM